MKKILFVSQEMHNVGGGSVISNRNYEVLTTLFPHYNIIRYNIHKPKKKTIISVLDRCIKHYVNGVNNIVVTEVITLAKECDFVWIDNSSYGALCKRLRNKGYRGKTIIFFHNIEYLFQKRPIIKRLLYPIFNLPLKNAEKDAAHNSDFVFALTARDRDIINTWNISVPIYILPSSIKDSYKKIDNIVGCNNQIRLLFVGTKFYANVNGIKWFVENVMPSIDAHLTIVGSGMDKLSFPKNENIEIHGFVQDLAPYYCSAHCVIAPIFEGSGMKTKTTEALMWGKYIVGTSEAFCGFDITEAIGICCDSKDDFIEAINNIDIDSPKFNTFARDLYLKKYSFEQSIQIVSNVLNHN